MASGAWARSMMRLNRFVSPTSSVHAGCSGLREGSWVFGLAVSTSQQVGRRPLAQEAAAGVSMQSGSL
ncbi:MAG TPA: hypothetical protein VKU88_08900 [Acidimicrobiales bacterium]|nr:hypothetical protein [Acidimicrobiales bacterium]